MIVKTAYLLYRRCAKSLLFLDAWAIMSLPQWVASPKRLSIVLEEAKPHKARSIGSKAMPCARDDYATVAESRNDLRNAARKPSHRATMRRWRYLTNFAFCILHFALKKHPRGGAFFVPLCGACHGGTCIFCNFVVYYTVKK